MQLKRFKLGAVIPTTQYGNIQPEVEYEGGDTSEMMDKASSVIEGIWNKYGSSPLTINKNSGGTEIKSFTGESLIYDPVAHQYRDLEGNILLSGSVYASRQSKPFDKAMMLPKTAKAWGVAEADIDAMWTMSGKVANELGSSIHTALEVWHKYGNVGARIQEVKDLEENYALPKNPILKNIVKDFDEKFGRDALSEVLVSDVGHKMAGQIDRLVVVDKDKMICRIGDYKSNYELDDKKIITYQHQLSFYAQILTNKGWKVDGLDIYHYSDGWELITLPVLEVKI